MSDNTDPRRYIPSPPPIGESRPEEIRRIWEEFRRLQDAIMAIADGHLELETDPDTANKPREGDLRLADGLFWDPGERGLGKGLYIYLDGEWKQFVML